MRTSVLIPLVPALLASAGALALDPSAKVQPAKFEPGDVRNLAGWWSGEGRLTPESGPVEGYKCTVTYFPSADGSEIKQNLRCRNAQSKFDAATHLSIKGGKVTGTWEDKVYSLAGTVAGTTKDGGFDLVLDSSFFKAKMVVVSSACEQQVTVVPGTRGTMKEMAAVLKRC